MKTLTLLNTLAKDGFSDKFIPVLNIWLFYVIVNLVLFAIFSAVVCGLISIFFVIIGYFQEEKTKKAIRKWWVSRPFVSFHLFGLIIQFSVLLYLISVTKIPIFNKK